MGASRRADRRRSLARTAPSASPRQSQPIDEGVEESWQSQRPVGAI